MPKHDPPAVADTPFRNAHDAPPVILLVDDEKAFADTLAFRLQARGIPTAVAYRGEDALEVLDRPELEVVLLDLNMPGLHGLDALRRIKGQRPDVEVILLTGEANLSVAAKGMRRGAGDYLLKPVDCAVLFESLDKARQRAAEYRERQRAAEAGKLMALGALAAGVGHEINNPLQVITQYSEWLQELVDDAAQGRPDLEGMAKAAGIIQKQAARAVAITAQLLDLAHKSRASKAEARLSDLIPKVLDIQAERAAFLGAAISVDVAPDLPVLSCSPAELEPVLHHLVKNALDAIEALHGGAGHEGASSVPAGDEESVRVTAALAGDMIRITIEDTGEGIAPEHAPRIFDPFFSTRPVGKGTGLGLTVCHSIVYALRGRMRFAPAEPRGTVFTVEIPVVRDPAP